MSISLAINPTTPSTLYAGTYGTGVFKSTDAGASWSADNADLADPYVFSLAINPTSPSIVYAGTYGGVFKTSFLVGDFDGDGKSDILWRNTSSGQNAVWYMNGATVTGVSVFTGSTDQNWTIVGVGDFNNDGLPDILWRNTSTGENEVWYMNGVMVTGVAFLPYLDPASGWSIVGVGDFNGDGSPDILWRNTSTGQNAVWYMNGVTVTGAAFLPYVNPASGWSIVGVGDFNGDGKPDILWRNTNGTNAVWYMNGATFISAVFLPGLNPASGWSIVGVGDFNGDGKPDILWRNTDGRNAIWYMNGVTVTGVDSPPYLDPALGWTIVGPK